jgi:beta-fructofuranosidase
MTGTESQEAAVVTEVQNHEEELQQPQKHLHRTSFHYQPVKNWMGDPNAPMYYKGYYHVFYQYNSVAAVWGNMSWGHAVSKDLIHWLHLESAMEPDQLYDARGVWSGSATIDPDGIPFVLYTGRAEEKLEQVQNMAVPADPSDPLLRKWVKVPHNPILKAHPGVAEHCFRDPSTAWQLSHGGWVVIVGAMIDGAGVALQYRSTDLKQWELEEKWLHSCAKSGMWECVDFFPIDYDMPTDRTDTQKYVFKASVFDETLDYYTVGTYDEVAQKFTPDDPKLDIGHGFRLDYGKYYAAKSFLDPVKNRRIMWAWVHESCTEEMNIRRGWSSLLVRCPSLTLFY